MSDNVYDVAHYKKLPGGFEVWDLILKMGIGREAALSNVLKYVHRFADKNGLEDLKKAEVYLAELIRIEEGGNVSSITGNQDESVEAQLDTESVEMVDSEKVEDDGFETMVLTTTETMESISSYVKHNRSAQGTGS